jgi:hypothetical protein
MLAFFLSGAKITTVMQKNAGDLTKYIAGIDKVTMKLLQ